MQLMYLELVIQLVELLQVVEVAEQVAVEH